ncbi:NACHT domain-containing protein [Kitasatospora mediocidica]|uniref:NACHT domain-containing protein n=1 Tax=Kitasatospora mediocidica TaxID=58352 RepID=UPI000568E3BF|nr:NACHT domain-containing protein [Kitasatospora mediocidica]
MDEQTAARGGVHNSYQGGRAEFIVMAGSVSGGITYAPTQLPPEATREERAALALAKLVGAQWDAEVVVRRLFDPVPIPTRWTTDHSGYADHARLTGSLGRDAAVGDLGAFVEAFRALPAGRLMVLGEAGSGKSTLVVLLLRELLKRRQAKDPVPVLLPLASWNPEADHLDTWLAARLSQEYPHLLRAESGGPAVMTRLVEAGLILPVLDGLDEMEAGLRGAAVARLNEVLDWPVPLIVTSRAAEYDLTAGQAGILRAAALLRARRLTQQDVVEHLRVFVPPHLSARWQPVVAAITEAPDGPLAVTLAQPLLLGVVRELYRDPADPSPLLDFVDAPSLENHLLDALVPGVFKRPPAPVGSRQAAGAWNGARAERWLGYLAGELTRHKTEDWAWWELHRSVSRRRRAAVVGVLSAGAMCLTVAFALGFDALLFSAAMGCGFGALVPSASLGERVREGLLAADGKGSGRGHGRARVLLTKPLSRSAVTVAFAVIGGLCVTVIGLRFHALDESFASLALVVVGIGCSAGVGFLVHLADESPRSWDAPLTVRQSLSLARRKAAGVAFGVGLSVSALGMVILSCVFLRGAGPGQESDGRTAVLLAGLLVGVLIAPGALLVTAWASYQQTRLWLALTGRLPWRLTRFLHDAHHLGVLRQVGTVYQFRHARLRERLAARAAAGAVSAVPVPASRRTDERGRPPGATARG